MKRYDLMSKKEIFDAFDMIKKLPDNTCTGCVLYDWETQHGSKHRCGYCSGTCSNILTEFLKEDVELVPRWKTIKSNNDLSVLLEEYESKEDGEVGVIISRFIDFLNGEVEAYE